MENFVAHTKVSVIDTETKSALQYLKHYNIFNIKN
jgi:hypothetical protein